MRPQLEHHNFNTWGERMEHMQRCVAEWAGLEQALGQQQQQQQPQLAQPAQALTSASTSGPSSTTDHTGHAPHAAHAGMHGGPPVRVFCEEYFSKKKGEFTRHYIATSYRVSAEN